MEEQKKGGFKAQMSHHDLLVETNNVKKADKKKQVSRKSSFPLLGEFKKK